MNARLNATHLHIDVWAMTNDHMWSIVKQYDTMRVDLKPKKQIGPLKFNIIGDWVGSWSDLQTPHHTPPNIHKRIRNPHPTPSSYFTYSRVWVPILLLPIKMIMEIFIVLVTHHMTPMSQ